MKITNLFTNKNLTKWIPLGRYEFAGYEFIVFVRGNKKTGELYFKTKCINKIPLFNPASERPIMNHTMIDVNKQWNLINEQINN